MPEGTRGVGVRSSWVVALVRSRQAVEPLGAGQP